MTTPSTESGATLVGVCGGSGSGKTTLCAMIADGVGRDRIAVISHDAYYRDFSSIPKAELDQRNFDHPDALESELLIEHLTSLRAGEAVETPIYDFTVHRRTEGTRRIDPHRVVLVEGILIFAEESLRNQFDVKIFVDVEPDIRLMRRLERDITERGRSLPSVLAQYQSTVRPMHLEFVESYKRYADVIIPRGGRNEVALDLVLSRIRQLAGTD